MRFTIIATKAGHQPPQSRCDFYTPGGTIGRSSDNNLVLPDNDRAISRLQAIVHVDSEGRCSVTNRGSVTSVVMNNIPLERGRQVELQEGDILAIDDYRIEVTAISRDTSSASQQTASEPAQTAPALLTAPAPEHVPDSPQGKPAAVPTEIWDSLMQEFSISDSISHNHRAQPSATALPDPLSQPTLPSRNAEDPLAIYQDSDPQLEHKNVDPSTFFNDDGLFNSESILDDVTPPPCNHRLRINRRP